MRRRADLGRAARGTEIDGATYLEGEKTAQVKHEYIAGEVFAMTGASRRHGRIVLNIASRLDAASEGGLCEAYANDVKVRVAEADAWLYHDVVVTCDPTDTDPYVLHSPRLVVEVLSPSTEAYDRGRKLRMYMTVSSIEAVLLVETERRGVQALSRGVAGVWEPRQFDDGPIDAPGVTLPLTIEDIYGRVDLTGTEA